MPKRMLLESKGKVYREFFKKKINIKFGIIQCLLDMGSRGRRYTVSTENNQEMLAVQENTQCLHKGTRRREGKKELSKDN
jgi:hypothetical protein